MKVIFDVHPAYPEDGIKVVIRVQHEPIDQKLIDDPEVLSLIERINDIRRGHLPDAEPPSDRSYEPLQQYLLLELIEARAQDLKLESGAMMELTAYLYGSRGLIRWPPSQK